MTKSILRCMIFVMGCLVCAATLVADQPADEATLKRWQEDAEKGNAYAMYNLGRYYADEEYPDREKAFEWFLKSAEKSCVEGEYVVGRCYLDGDGVERNVKEAFKWLKLAARHRSPEALYVLGHYHIYGYFEEVPKDPRQALQMLKQAAGLNNPGACAMLGMAWYFDCDWETADAAYKQRVLRLMTNAAKQDFAPAQAFLVNMYSTEGDEAIPQDKEKAYYWKTKLVEQDKTKAYQLGYSLVMGEGCEMDIAQGIEHFMAAGKPPYLSDRLTLACCFLVDGVVSSDDKDMLAKMETTVGWLNEEREDGNETVKTLLEAGYQAGKTGKEDVQTIADHLQTQAEQGDANAMYLLGTFERIGVGRERNPEKAVEWMRKAAEKEHADAELFLAGCLQSGHGMKRDIKEAREYLQRAAAHDSAEGKELYNNRCQWELFFEDFRPSLLE